MNKKLFAIFLIFLVQALFSQALDSYIWRHFTTSEKFYLAGADTSYQLTNKYLLAGSERLFLKNHQLSQIVYRIDQLQGILNLVNTEGIKDTVTIYYSYYPLDLPLKWQRNRLMEISDTTDYGSKRRMVSAVDKKESSYIGAINKQGSISRGFSIGTNQSLSLQSGLNFQLSGQLSENVFVDASLTDENTPIQPEGNTLALNEVDNVFIKFRAPLIDGIIGDFYLEQPDFMLNPLRKKLQGLDLTGRYENHEISGTYATAEGNFYTNFFIGQEGRQGPYLLKGKSGETDIVVLAGTEKVFVNGIQMQRGQNYDYIIDYSVGEINFTPNRPIMGNDRINVDFEYTSYNQSFGKNYLRILYKYEMNSNWGAKIGWFREKDDIDNLLIGASELTAEEKKIIAEAGDDQLSASTPGATYVGPNQGNYVDSLDLVSGDTIYVWADRGKGTYQVTFTDVGQGLGDYVRESLGYYRYVGKSLGQYLPIKLLALPKNYDMIGLRIEGNYDRFDTDIEVNYSSLDKNTLSNISETDNEGLSARWNWGLKSEDFAFLGKTRVNQYWRFRSKNFNSFERFNAADFQNRWALTEESQSVPGNELLNETSISVEPWKHIILEVNGGLRRETDYYDSWRLGQRLSLSLFDSLLIQEQLEYVSSKYVATQNESNYQTGFINISKPIGNWRIGVKGNAENREEQNISAESRGWRKIGGSGSTKWQKNIWSTSFDLGAEKESAIYNKNWEEYANTWQMRIGTGIISDNANGSLSWFHRDRRVDETFQKLSPEEKEIVLNPLYSDTTLISQKSDLVKLWWRHQFPEVKAEIRFDYEVGSEQTPIIEKYYLEVENTRGTFVYDSTLSQWVPDNNGTHVLILIPTGNYEPVTTVKANFGFNWQGRGIYSPLELNRSPTKKFLEGIKVVTQWQLEEQSKTEDLLSLFLMLPDAIQTDSTVSSNITFRQDIYWYYSEKRDYFNIRYQSRSGLFRQFLDAEDNDTQQTHQFDLFHHWSPGKSFINDVILGYKTQKRETSNASTKPEDIISYKFEDKLTWRFWQNWTQSFSIELANESNEVENNYIELFYDQILWQLFIPFAGKGRIQANFSRLEVQVLNADENYVIPFSMAKGKKEGVNLNWNITLGYSLNQYININANYNGRKDANFDKILHTGQAEIKAFF